MNYYAISLSKVVCQLTGAGQSGIEKLRGSGSNAKHFLPAELDMITENIDFSCGTSTSDVDYALHRSQVRLTR